MRPRYYDNVPTRNKGKKNHGNRYMMINRGPW